MPDLTYEVMEQCSGDKNTRWVGGYYQSGIGTEQPKCSCLGFKYHKNCKHIEQVLNEMCPYHELTHGKPKTPGWCPLCGGPTQKVYVGV